MEKPNDIKRDSISVNYFLNTAAYSGLFSLRLFSPAKFLRRHRYMLGWRSEFYLFFLEAVLFL